MFCAGLAVMADMDDDDISCAGETVPGPVKESSSWEQSNRTAVAAGVGSG